MTQSDDSLSRLTLRQLRSKASDLGVPLYSRKSKAALLKEIALYQNKKQSDKHLFSPFWRAPSSNSEASSSNESKLDTKVVFLPRDPQWAYVFWEISEADRNRAAAQGAIRLCLRLSDVTGIQDGTAHHHTLQEVQVDSHSTEWYLSIPLSNRDYRVELGYLFQNSWTSLAFSEVARVPSLQPSTQIFDQFVPFSLEVHPESAENILDPNPVVEQKDNGLHERLYQSATTHFRKTRIGSEEFQENRRGNFGFSDSGSGIWASGQNESGIGGVALKKNAFWLVADAELIVYGATDPSASLTIGGESVPLSNDGTFRLQVPFRDGLQKYPIEASFSKGEQKRNITMQFERITPEDNTTPSDQAHQVEWF